MCNEKEIPTPKTEVGKTKFKFCVKKPFLLCSYILKFVDDMVNENTVSELF